MLDCINGWKLLDPYCITLLFRGDTDMTLSRLSGDVSLDAIHHEYIDSVKGYMKVHQVGILEYKAVGNARCTLFTDGSVLSVHQGPDALAVKITGDNYEFPEYPIERLTAIDPVEMESIVGLSISLSNKHLVTTEFPKCSLAFDPPTPREELQFLWETITESVELIIPILKKMIRRER